eukprot:TRINITY_DN305_c4_g1_i2.p1 TRINITY_DN305_c4_g1~~TRINITY_DN305_c4_g1_i2.p1  ORF type:complete len:814 (+),score=67.33 TRINITY_DN305_c4_g1_i2:159-2600(+)
MSLPGRGILPEVGGAGQSHSSSSHRLSGGAVSQVASVQQRAQPRSPSRQQRQQRDRRQVSTEAVSSRGNNATVRISHQKTISQARDVSQIISPRFAKTDSSSKLLPDELYRLQDPALNVSLPEPGYVDPSSLDNRELDKLMSNVGKNKATWRRVLMLHEWLQAIGHKPDNRLCTTLIRVCSQHGQALTALAVYEWMRKEQQQGGGGLECTVYTYTAAMRAALGGNLLDRALEVWQDSQKVGCEPDARLCTVFIEVCSRLNRTDDALKMYSDMLNAPRDAAMAPTVHAFTTAMRAATEGGKWDKSLEIWQDMENYGCAPTGHAYAAAISACAAGSQWVTAVKLFEDMISNKIKPDVVSCTALITALATHAEHDRAEKVVTWMLKTGVTPNVRTYTALVTAMGNAKQWQKAICVICNMERPEYGGVTPNAYTYSALLKSLGEHGQWSLAESVFTELEAGQIQYLVQAATELGYQNKSAYETTNIDGTCESVAASLDANASQARVLGNLNNANTVDMLWTNAVAQAIMGQAIVNDPALLTNPDFIQQLTNLQITGNVLSTQGSSSTGVQPTQSNYDMLANFPGLNQDTLYQLASKRRNSPLNEVVCGALMLAYERSGKWEEAVRVIDRARNMGIPPNNVMFNTAMSAAGKAGRLDVARSLFEQISEPDAVTYETLIAAYGTAGDVENAEDMFKRMVESSYKPRDYAYCGLIAAYSYAGDLNNALRVRQRMQTARDNLTVHVYNALIAACEHCRDYSKAMEIFQTMRRTGVEPNKVTMDLVRNVGVGGVQEVEKQQLATAALSAMGALGMAVARNLF